jgi:hypothetical protein
VSVRVSGGIGYSGQGNRNCHGQALFWYKLVDYSFHKKIKVRGSVKASAALSANISSVSPGGLFLQNMEMILCVWLEDETQKL